MAADEISGGMNDMALGADRITSTVEQVNGISIKTRENIESLFAEVSKFKVT